MVETEPAWRIALAAETANKFMNSFLTPPAGYGPAMLGLMAALGFALAALTLPPTLSRDAGVPDMSELTQAHGQVVGLERGRYGVKFRLDGRTETFSYPSKAGASGVVGSALAAAADRQVTVLFDPNPRTTWFSSSTHYVVWQLAIRGQSIRTMAEARTGWRSDNRVAAWLFPCFLFGCIYFAVLAWRARLARIRFDDRSWIDLA